MMPASLCGRRRVAHAGAAALLAPMVLAGCAAPPPLRIGVLVDLTGRTSGFMEDCRDGVLLGAEQINQSGGIRGRRVELVMRDQGLGEVQNRAEATSLIDTGVQVVVGPFTSAVALRVLPVFDAARVLLLCPMCTADALAGRDDFLLRLNRTSQQSANDYAETLYRRGQRRVAMATLLRDTADNGAWRSAFRARFTALGGALAADLEYGVSLQPSLRAVMRGMLEARPDGLVFVATGVDAARLAQQADKFGAHVPMAAPDWAASRALLDLGGRAVEGMLVGSAFRLGDSSARYRDFRLAYQTHFEGEPNFRSIVAYDALMIAAQVLAGGHSGTALRDAVLQGGPYQGVLQTVRFDRFGDAASTGHFMVVRNGSFEALT